MDISFVTRKIQKSMAGLSVLAILTSLVSFAGIASADTFTDVSTSNDFYDYVDQISDAGIMTGYGDGTFGVDDYLTKDQAAKVLVLAFDYPVDTTYDAGFSDVSSTNDLEDYINTAAEYDIVSGNPDGTFGSGENVNRATLAKMTVDAAGIDVNADYQGLFTDSGSSDWWTLYAETAYDWSILDGYSNGMFGAADMATRGQEAKIATNAMAPVWRGDDTTDDDTTTSTGDLTVEVSNDSPDATTIPYNATSVELAAWDFTANGGDVTIDSLSVHQYGISTLGTSHQVYLYEGSDRLTSGTTVSSTDNEATFTYDIEVQEGETRTISIRGDNLGSSTTTGEVGLEITSASKVEIGEGSVDGDFPAQGAKHSLSTTAAGTLTIEKNGNVDNPQVGQDGATIAKFKMSSATEAAGVEELGIYLAGSINTTDVENFSLYVTGDDAEAIATAEMVDDLDVIRFDISGAFDNDSDECENSDGYCIAKGGSKSFYVTGDFNTGRTDDTVKAYVDQSTDVFARGALYGSGMAITRGSYNGDTDSSDSDSTACSSTTDADCSYSLLEGGDITISSNGPSASDIATNARDVSVLDFSIVSVTDVTFDSFPISMDTSSDASDDSEGLLSAAAAANFTDVKIMNTDTGAALYAGVDSTSFVTSQGGATVIAIGTDDAAAYHLFTDDFEMSTGEELNLALTMDVANVSTLDGMTFTASLDLGATYPQLKDTNNKTLTNSSVLVPSSAITSKTMTVKTPSLALSLASTPAAVVGGNTYVKGTDAVPFTGIVFACGNASDCRVTDLSLQGYYDDEGDNTDFDSASDSADHTVGMTTVVGSVWLEDGEGNEIAASKSINSSTFVVTYDSMDWDIEAGDTAIAYVMGDLSTNATTQNVAFGISSTANVTVEDTDGNSFTPTGTVNVCDATCASGTYITTSAGGSLTVAVSSSTARENIAIAGTSDVEVSSFEFTSTREAFSISKLALNNRQSAVTATTTLGDYDNNVSSVTIEYEDSDGVTQESTAYLVSGTASFSGLDVYVPADDSTTITAYATLNSISSSGSTATAAEFVDLSLAYSNFEAVAQGSGETYKADKIDAGVAAASDLDFGTITYTDPTGAVLDGAVTTDTLGATITFYLDEGDDTAPLVFLPVGTVVCLNDEVIDAVADVETNGACSTDDAIAVIQSVTTGSTESTYTAILADDADTATLTNAVVYYSLPGTGFHSGTNQMVVYESKPTLALASSTPSGSRSVSASDDAFAFTVSADAKEKVQITASSDFTGTCASATGGGTVTVTDAALTTITVDGSSCNITSTNTSGDSVGFPVATSTAGAGTLQNYSYVSFWFRWNDADAALATLLPTELTVATSDANDGTDDQSTAVAVTNIAGSPSHLIEDTWYYIKDVAMPALTDSSDTFLSIVFTDANAFAATDNVYIDQVRAYTQKIEVDMSSDLDFDRSYNQGSTCATAGNTGCPVIAYLKESGNTVATGYIDTVPTAAVAGVEDAIDDSLAVVTFVPTSTQGTIEIAKGTTKTYTVNLSTSNLLVDDAGVDDPLTFSIDYGSSSGGTVTAGDFWWYETNATVRWVGNTSNTSLTSNTVKY